MNMQDKPLVSIVISVYRRDRFLPLAIQSALNQTWPNVEIIVAEDGGSDCATPVVAGFSQPPARLRLIRQPSNKGAAANKLNAWNQAKGEFLVNLDDDDLLDPEFVAKLLPPLLNDDSIVLSFCDHFQIDEQGDVDLPATEMTTALWKRDVLAPGLHRPFLELGLVDQSIPFAMGSLWCKSRLNLSELRIEAGPSYDLYMTYMAARAGLGAWYIPERLSSYRVHSGMETQTGRERIHHANIFCNRRFLADPVLAPWRQVFVARLADAYAGLAVISLRQGKRLSAIVQFVQSCYANPTRRAVAGIVYSFLPHGAERVY
jgi:glycosyltransferase involved in cell wall biosynthesis